MGSPERSLPKSLRTVEEEVSRNIGSVRKQGDDYNGSNDGEEKNSNRSETCRKE
jgi:hypothetical protein